MWHCPHCGAPQAETARCWVCRKSSTTCSTCRHFRLSLSADVGWCALDPKRLPLTGLEQRGCWQERSGSAPATATETGVRARRHPRLATVGDPAEQDESPPLDFIPVELLGRFVISSAPAQPERVEAISEPVDLMPPVATDPDESWTDRTSLFGELET